MSDLRDAARQALEAWEYINKYGFVLADYEGPMEQAIIALKAALHLRQHRMADHQARALARDHKGVALVRATEQHHGIH